MAEFLSIGIPAKNEERSLRRTVGSIVKSTAWLEAPKDRRELMIGVNGSTDETVEVARALKKEIPEIRIINAPEGKGKTGALNAIAKAAHPDAEMIYFSDADVLVEKDTIGKTLAALRKSKGKQFAAPLATPLAVLKKPRERTPLDALFVELAEHRKNGGMHALFGCAWAVKKRFLLENPLPEHPLVFDDHFINLAYADKIKIVDNARVLYETGDAADGYKTLVRNNMAKKNLLKLRPDLAKENKKRRAFVLGVKRRLFPKLSPKAKVGAVIFELAQRAAGIVTRVKKKGTWTAAKSTKLI